MTIIATRPDFTQSAIKKIRFQSRGVTHTCDEERIERMVAECARRLLRDYEEQSHN